MALRTASRLVKLCRAEVGYHEKASNSDLYDKAANSGDKNYTKYAKENHDAGMYNGNKQGFAYCDVFVDNMFLHLCDMDPVEAEKRIFQTGDLGAGCMFSAQYYKTAGRFSVKPFVGDQVFFRDFEHTGIVTAVNDYEITVVEGNSNNRVEENKYSRVDPDIDGYGHPEFDSEPVPVPVPKPEKHDEEIYDSIDMVPWYERNEIKAYIDDGSLKGYGDKEGLRLPASDARILTIVERHLRTQLAKLKK